MRTLMRACLVILVSALALPAIAQSPNTSTLVVVVVDQTGAVVNDAKVTRRQQRHRRDPRGGVRRRRLGDDLGALADRHLHDQRREAGLHRRRRHGA